jgi:hypothetical protein
VAERPCRSDMRRCSSDHPPRIGTDSRDLAGQLVDRHHRRLEDDNSVPATKHDRVRCPEINGKRPRTTAPRKQPHPHTGPTVAVTWHSSGPIPTKRRHRSTTSRRPPLTQLPTDPHLRCRASNAGNANLLQKLRPATASNSSSPPTKAASSTRNLTRRRRRGRFALTTAQAVRWSARAPAAFASTRGRSVDAAPRSRHHDRR